MIPIFSDLSSTAICSLMNSFSSRIHFTSMYSPFFDTVRPDASTIRVTGLSSYLPRFRFTTDGLIFRILLYMICSAKVHKTRNLQKKVQQCSYYYFFKKQYHHTFLKYFNGDKFIVNRVMGYFGYYNNSGAISAINTALELKENSR
jgi:hypothetical protein